MLWEMLKGVAVAGKVEMCCEEWWSALQDSGALL